MGGGPHQLDHGELRNGKALAGTFDDQRRDDRQGKRDLDDELGATPLHRGQLDGAADLLDVGTHHVHADATAGDRRHGRRRREAGLEDVLLDLLLAHRIELGLACNPVLDALLLDLFGGQAFAVIRDLDDDVTALVEGIEGHGPDLGLARLDAVGRDLQTMVGRIAHHVGERVLDQLQHLAIELRLRALHHQVDFLVEFVRQIPDDAGQLRPSIADRLHAGGHDAFLQLRNHVVQALQGRGELAFFLAAQDLQQLIARQDQLGDHGHQVLEHVYVDAQRLIGDRTFLLGIGSLGFGRNGARRRCAGLRRFRLGFGCVECRLWCLFGLGDRRGLRVSLGFSRCALLGRLLRRQFLRPLGRLESGLQLVEVDGAATAASRRLLGLGFLRRCLLGLGFLRRCRSGRRRRAAIGEGVQARDEVGIVALRLRLGGFKLFQQGADVVEAFQNQGDRFRGDLQLAIAQLAQHVLAGVRDTLQSRQPKEPTGTLDGVHQAENIPQKLRVVRVLLQLNQFDIELREALVRLGKKFA